jgi:hypothetical protein
MWREVSNGGSAELVGVAQPIVGRGEIGGKGGRLTERAVLAIA